jgi:hypothetical protein
MLGAVVKRERVLLRGILVMRLEGRSSGARLGIDERGEEFGNRSRESVPCEMGMGGRGNFALCTLTRSGDSEGQLTGRVP